MTEAEQALLDAVGLVNNLPHGDRALVLECRRKLKALVRKYGEHGEMALGLLGAELQAKH